MKFKLKIYFMIISMSLSTFSSCLDSDKSNLHIYILTRNSQTKEGNIVLKYNQTQNNISHIGLALDNYNENFVYNISYDGINDNGSSLLKEEVKDFWNSPNTYDNRIWKISLTENERARIIDLIENFEKMKMLFDFDPLTSNGMYCSEFVYTILKHANSEKFHISPQCKELNKFESLLVGQEYLCYYPADFFLSYTFAVEILKDSAVRTDM